MNAHAWSLPSLRIFLIVTLPFRVRCPKQDLNHSVALHSNQVITFHWRTALVHVTPCHWQQPVTEIIREESWKLKKYDYLFPRSIKDRLFNVTSCLLVWRTCVQNQLSSALNILSNKVVVHVKRMGMNTEQTHLQLSTNRPIVQNEWLNSAGTSRNGVSQPESGVPQPKVLAPPPGDAICSVDFHQRRQSASGECHNVVQSKRKKQQTTKVQCIMPPSQSVVFLNYRSNF